MISVTEYLASHPDHFGIDIVELFSVQSPLKKGPTSNAVAAVWQALFNHNKANCKQYFFISVFHCHFELIETTTSQLLETA